MNIDQVLAAANWKKPEKVVGDGEFFIASIGLDHGHIYGITEGLISAGAQLKWVYGEPEQMQQFSKSFPQAKIANSEEEILRDPQVHMVVSASVPSERAPLGIRVMNAGKHFFVDKAPMTTLSQLNQVREACLRTEKKYAVAYTERIFSESAYFADLLIKRWAIGKVLQVIGLGPHHLHAHDRPSWFFEREKYGGILFDIGSHQIEQFLYYTGAQDATITGSSVANYNHPAYPELEDFGEINVLADNGSTGYFRVDWFTPDGLSAFGDGRTLILGTDGFIELRKYVNLGMKGELAGMDHVLWADHAGEYYCNVTGKIGLPFFGQLIRDCLDGTEIAMTQQHALKAAELCLLAQLQARKITP